MFRKNIRPPGSEKYLTVLQVALVTEELAVYHQFNQSITISVILCRPAGSCVLCVCSVPTHTFDFSYKICSFF
jgi:hypothetical protein